MPDIVVVRTTWSDGKVLVDFPAGFPAAPPEYGELAASARAGTGAQGATITRIERIWSDDVVDVEIPWTPPPLPPDGSAGCGARTREERLRARAVFEAGLLVAHHRASLGSMSAPDAAEGDEPVTAGTVTPHESATLRENASLQENVTLHEGATLRESAALREDAALRQDAMWLHRNLEKTPAHSLRSAAQALTAPVRDAGGTVAQDLRQLHVEARRLHALVQGARIGRDARRSGEQPGTLAELAGVDDPELREILAEAFQLGLECGLSDQKAILEDYERAGGDHREWRPRPGLSDPVSKLFNRNKVPQLDPRMDRGLADLSVRRDWDRGRRTEAGKQLPPEKSLDQVGDRFQCGRGDSYDAAAEKERAAALENMLASLDPEDRRLVLYVVEGGMSVAEAGRTVWPDVTETASQARAKRIMLRLRRNLDVMTLLDMVTGRRS